MNAHWGGFERVLRESPAYMRQKDSNGCLPIHLACKTGAPDEVVKNFLMIYPWAVHVQDEYGLLPIHYVAEGKMQTIKII